LHKKFRVGAWLIDKDFITDKTDEKITFPE